jgi:hypothetical protein
MGMIGKMYLVQKGHMLTGKHRVYVAGENMPEEELCGDWQGSIKDGVIVEVGTAPTPQAAQAPAREPPGASDSAEGEGSATAAGGSSPPPTGSGAQKKGKKGGGA